MCFPHRQERFALPELLVVMAILGVLMSLGVLSVRGLQNDVGAAANILNGAFVEARTRATGTTSAVRARLVSGALVLETSPSCPPSGAFTVWAKMGALKSRD